MLSLFLCSISSKIPPFTCVLCTSILDQVVEEIEDGQVISPEKIKDLCTSLPETYQAVCNTLADQIVSISEDLSQKIKTYDICQKVTLCPEDDSNSIKPRSQIKDDEVVENGVLCGVCKDFIKWAKGELSTYTVEGIMYLVKNKCPGVKYISSICSHIKESEVETIVRGLISKIPDETICTKIKFC